MHQVRVFKVEMLTGIVILELCISQGSMGVTSSGLGFGSTFFFALPVYGSDFSPPTDHLQQQPDSRPFSPPLESLPLNQLPLPKPSNQELQPSSVFQSPSISILFDETEDRSRSYSAIATSEIDIGAVPDGTDNLLSQFFLSDLVLALFQ